MFVQNFGWQTKCILSDVEVANGETNMWDRLKKEKE